MDIKVTNIQKVNDNVDYTTGYFIGCTQATEDYKKGKPKKKKQNKSSDYNQGFEDGYQYTYSKCQEKSVGTLDELSEMLKEEVLI